MAKHGGKGPRTARKRQGSGGHSASAGGGEMVKHRGFPSRMTGTDFQFTIRRAGKEGATKIIRRERFADRRNVDREADRQFMAALWDHFGEEPFERGNLDAGRLSWLFGREVKALDDPFDPQSYEAVLQIDRSVAEASFPEIFAPDAAPQSWDDFDFDDEAFDDEDEDDGDWDDDDAGAPEGAGSPSKRGRSA